MKRTEHDTLVKIQLIQEAVEAMRNVINAEAAGQPEEELQRLHFLAESVVRAVGDHGAIWGDEYRTLH